VRELRRMRAMLPRPRRMYWLLFYIGQEQTQERFCTFNPVTDLRLAMGRIIFEGQRFATHTFQISMGPWPLDQFLISSSTSDCGASSTCNHTFFGVGFGILRRPTCQ
jgi:hypothetical protein